MAKAKMTHEEMVRAVCPENPTWHIEARGRDLAQLLLWLVGQTPTGTREALMRGAREYLSWRLGRGRYPTQLHRGKAAARAKRTRRS
jgi:hypothetical protein